MLLLVSSVVRAPDVQAVQTIGTLIAGLASLGTFILVEHRAATPLIRLGILRSAPLVRANLGAVLLVGSFVGFQFIAVLYLQELRQWSELETGLALMIVGLDSILAPTLTPLLVNRFGNSRVIFGGFVLAAAAYALFLPVGAEWTYAAMLPTLILLSLAFSLAYGPLTIAATDGVAEAEQGLAGGVLTTSFQFGSALGLAVVVAVITETTPTPAQTLDGFRTALFVPLAAAILGLLASAAGLVTRPAMESAEAQ
jgi:predicted MFS family arabinose efflux permease